MLAEILGEFHWRSIGLLTILSTLILFHHYLLERCADRLIGIDL